MIQPDYQTQQLLLSLARQHPQLRDWFEAWKQRELSSLPYTGDKVHVAQGRCQVLTEVCKLLQVDSTMGAQPRRGS